jgi:hypothetical protein
MPTSTLAPSDQIASNDRGATTALPAPAFTPLARIPLVPDAVLKRHGAYCAIDTRFRSAARLLQCIWLKDRGISAASPAPRVGMPTAANAFSSILSPEAARAGKNFLTPAIHRLALQELLLREDDAAIDEDRLFGNALSSMPLVFNLLAPLASDRDLATAVFRRLLPEFVHSVERIIFEHSPGRRENRFLADRTAFDAAIRVITPDGELATVYVEAKYSESMEGPAARMRDRYNEASRQVRLYRDPDSALLRSLALEQIWREHMTAQLAVDHGITARAMFVGIAPRLNRRVQAAFRVYEAELLDADERDDDRVAFAPLTLEAMIEAIADAGASETAHALWGRYCNFAEVYRLSMQELADTPALSEPAVQGKTGSSLQRKNKPALPAIRHRRSASSSNRHRTKVTSFARRRPTTRKAKQEAAR